MKPAVLLISPGILKWTDMDFGLPHLVSIGGYLRERCGVRVEILDLNYEGGDHEALRRRIDDLGPFLVIGLSLYSSFDFMRAMTLARFLRGAFPTVPLVTGGYHVSALPDDVLFDGSPFDAAVLGEGERPMLEIVETLLGGKPLEKRRYGPDVVPDLDALPPYAWDLLDGYWPRARDIGRKLQIYLARGCPYTCTFCMERAKSGYQWRAFSPERAVDELRRLGMKTDLGQWVVNLADPLFGFKRRWRREVLEGILRHDIRPRQFWTLTRSDDLDETDVELMARARFSIGIGMESGSPEMLETMQKVAQPSRYLEALRRLATLSRVHGLNWAANVILGHPGETPASLRETHAFVRELFLSAPETCGWVSIDPFRVYPGSHVHENLSEYRERFGTVFHRPEWWKSWYDGPFHAQHVEPSRTLSYEDRVRFMVSEYGPLIDEIQRRFRGQGRSVDHVYRRSIEEQRRILSPEQGARLIELHRRLTGGEERQSLELHVPLGLQLKDPWVRRREDAVRRLLDRGALRTERLAEALLQTAPERHMPADAAAALLAGKGVEVEEGALPFGLPIEVLAMGLEGLGPGLGDRVADATAASGYVSELLAHLVGPNGQVVAFHPCRVTTGVARALAHLPQVEVVAGGAADLTHHDPFDGVWVGAAMPRTPKGLVDCLTEEGRAIAFVGPRWRPQDLVCWTRREGRLDEVLLGRVKVPVLGGRWGWLPDRGGLVEGRPVVRFEAWQAPALAFHVLAHLDVGVDAAGLHDPRLPRPEWVPALTHAWHACPHRIAVQALALVHRQVEELLVALLSPPKPLNDASGQRLCRELATAMARESRGFLTSWTPRVEVSLRIGPALMELRSHLWAQRGRPPPLTVLHVPALGGRGRASWRSGERVVATDLHREEGALLMAVLHEEMHPVTDPLVLADTGLRARTRDTRPGTEGWAVHAELERVAVEATRALVEARAPGWSAAFERWAGSVETSAAGPA